MHGGNWAMNRFGWLLLSIGGWGLVWVGGLLCAVIAWPLFVWSHRQRA